MSAVLAIDPGNRESAYVVIDTATCQPIQFGKVPNETLADWIDDIAHHDLPALDRVAVEMVAAYGMPVGADVFETCVWIGRFVERLRVANGVPPELVKRGPVKLHHCRTSRAKDANIRQALVDRFAPGEPNHGKGTRAAPGWFYGFHTDVWQAYALAVYAADETEGRSS